MDNNVKTLREIKNMTQMELAEKSGLSLRTVQRIEAGSVLKGFTLKTIAHALGTEPEDLIPIKENLSADRAKLINLSALLGLILLFGGVIFPLILTYKTKDIKNKELGKSIVSVQIIITAILSVSMIISPFIQKALTVKFPLFLIPLVTLLCFKVYIIVKNGISLNQSGDLSIKLKVSFL